MKKILLSIIVLLVLFVAGCDLGALCGDGVCDPSEDWIDNCPEDCNVRPLPKPVCVDSDSGQDFFVKGEVSLIYESHGVSYPDTCVNDNFLIEQYCHENNPEGVEVECYDFDATCNDGACVKSETVGSCSDSDGGFYYNVRGFGCVNEEDKRMTFTLEEGAEAILPDGLGRIEYYKKLSEDEVILVLRNGEGGMSSNVSIHEVGDFPKFIYFLAHISLDSIVIYAYPDIDYKGEGCVIDKCANGIEDVNEVYCDGTLLERSIVDCSYGCESGVCLSSPVPPPPLPEDFCFDSDGGVVLDILGFVNGSVNGDSFSGRDFCAADKVVYEYFCDGDSINASLYDCSYGCENGVCLSSPIPPPVPTNFCFDSDGGVVLDVLGFVNGSFNGDSFSFVDVCVGDRAVNEYYCIGDYANVSPSYCPYGCENGVCKPATLKDSCFDSDNGTNPEVFGRTNGYFSGAFFNLTDYCVNKSILREYSCAGYALKYSSIACEDGCQNGVCLNIPDSILATGDDQISVYLNGNLLGISNKWSEAQLFELDLNEGDELLFTVRNSGGSAGFLAEINFKGQKIISDSSWIPTKEDNTPTIVDDKGVYGVYPWNKNVKLKDETIQTSAHWIWSKSNDLVLRFRIIIGEKLPKCFDSDGGKNFNLKGTMFYNGKLLSDSCLSERQILEYVCDGDNYQVINQTCPSVCENGACVKKELLNCDWSLWSDRDDPGGNGDFEPITSLCASTPKLVECYTTKGESWNDAGEKYTCDLSYGGRCINSQQSDGRCQDYKVRVCCDNSRSES
ncbi:MAG: hypothetical protein KKC26_08750 [Nanoarchaeota archaeon]|nr:hypothetical protein [Nanoarchaeota archaeon]MBU1850675.1 hypothetical protein [Nanoarchaeota archaeon]